MIYVVKSSLKIETKNKTKNIFFIKAKKNNILVSGNPGDQKIFTRVVAKKFFLPI